MTVAIDISTRAKRANYITSAGGYRTKSMRDRFHHRIHHPQYRDASYDSANVKLRKHIQYDTAKAQQNLYEYGADLTRKRSRTHYWESVSHGLSSIASGAGNVIGSFRP